MGWSKIKSDDAHHLSELRLVLLGCRTAGKSSSGNTILGSDEFDLRGSAQCVKRQGEVAGRKITVVEVPGWQSDKNVTQVLKQEIVLSVSMCPPGPHAVLLVMRLDFKSSESEKDALRGCMKLLTERVWRHSIILFTVGDGIRDQTIEQYIESKGKALQWLVEQCGNRYHVFNNNSRNDNTQVTELLEKIEKMVAGKGGGHLEIDTKILQEVKERKTLEEARSKAKRMKVSNPRSRKHRFPFRVGGVFNPVLNDFTAVHEGLIRSRPTSQKHDSLKKTGLIKNRSEENRIRFLPAGQIVRKSTDLVFKLEGQGKRDVQDSVLGRPFLW
ncbi:hypothetical protein AMELA_G00256250 [Ameiurus melas]|uniref:AIG1-type G domain-containing protein n=1 Tax=Ameiurus melas TaxID=219545 RepID=A0A7J5ZRW8_AMEME|nr:hypothetical protein AMELA_G00256250 [Ameiurus melas]